MKHNIHIWFTLGPSTIDDETLVKALEAGATGCRLTFSYGTAQLQIERAKKLKSIAGKLGKSCFVVADLAGEKFRVSDFDTPGVLLKTGREIVFFDSASKIKKTNRHFSVSNKSFFKHVNNNDKIIVGDGAVVFKVSSVEPDKIIAEVITEGIINPNRGLSVQGNSFSPEALTDKDISDLGAIFSTNLFDAVALSFVSSAEDIAKVQELMYSSDKALPVIAKIETPEGMKNVKEITLKADLVMAARGDLALNLDWKELPAAVNKIQEAALEANKPWILATQVMEGFERFAMPTRAEICDLAHWLSKGASGVLLSYETVFGKRPIEAINAVNQMAERWARTI